MVVVKLRGREHFCIDGKKLRRLMQLPSKPFSPVSFFTAKDTRLRLQRFLCCFLLGLGLSVLTIACRPSVKPLLTPATPPAESALNNFGVDFPVSIAYNYYSISGENAAQLREQMNQLGYKTSRGSFDAVTYWYVYWKYDYKKTNGSCGIDNPKVKVDIKFTMPKWNRDTNFEVGLTDHWNRYITALQLHEDGHRDHGIGAGKDILQVLKQQPSYPSCDEMGTAANAAAQETIALYNQKDIDYDRETGHGATQGARFP